MEWAIILTTIAAIGTAGSFGVTFYRWVYCPYKERMSKEKEEIYKPLRQDIEKLIERVRMLDGVEDEQPLTFWKETEGKIPSAFYSKLEDIFKKRFEEYCDWLKASQDFIWYKIYLHGYDSLSLNELKKEFEGLGGGPSFERRMYGSLVLPVLLGEDMSLSWFKEYDSRLWGVIEKCSHSDSIRSLLGWLKERNPCIETLRKIQSDLIKHAENIRDELNRKIK